MSPSPSTAARVGFSLVELLVVLAIIATMTGLVLGGLFRNRDANRLLAAEQVLGDAIRQARHTARSSGSPVELRLTQRVSAGTVTGATLAGTSRVCLWSETFDRERDSNEDGVIDDADLGSLPLTEPGPGFNGVVLGRSGNGRQPSSQFPIPMQTLPRGSTIVRGGRNDGFFLSCSMRMPMVASSVGTFVPLVLIGNDGSIDSSQCGIALQTFALNIQGPISAPVMWDVVGWVFNEAGTEKTLIQASTDPIPTHAWVDRLPTDVKDLPHPLAADRWIDVGLLYDGRRLVLYIDGVRIAERHDAIPAKLRASGDHIHIGSLLLPPSSTPPVLYCPFPLDDVRLFRLGAGDITDLPGSVVLVKNDGKVDPALGFRILCQPDGRVEVSRDDDADATPVNDRTPPKAGPGPRAGDSTTIVISQPRAPGTLQAAQLTITLDGRVSSKLLTQVPAATGGQP